jgi:hypothetical protein
VSEATAEVYVTMLADLDFDAAKEACARLMATSTFLPSIAEIRETVVNVQHGPQRTGEEAWKDVCAEIRAVGAYEAPRFNDPVVAECVRSLGWRTLCLGPNDAADRARFIALYDELTTRARKDTIAGRALPPAQGHAPPMLEPTLRRLNGGRR